MTTQVKKPIMEFAFIAFALLGVLFGMNIMPFIFGGLDPQTGFSPTSNTTINETGAFINTTAYGVGEAGNVGFRELAVVTAINASGQVITAGNYTVDATAGTITGTNFVNWSSVNVTYTYGMASSAEATALNVQEDSLTAVGTYASGSNTQFSTLSTAITLLLLLAIFAFFWRFFVGTSGKKSGMGSSNFG